jgi:hypothetical protein
MTASRVLFAPPLTRLSPVQPQETGRRGKGGLLEHRPLDELVYPGDFNSLGSTRSVVSRMKSSHMMSGSW